MKFPKSIVILLFSFFLLLQNTKEDLPVHCLASQIEGVWLLHLGNQNGDSSLKCGHSFPDKNKDHLNIKPETIFTQKHETIIQLERPNKVLSVKDNSVIGKWTMVYDEGFEFTIKDKVFFAFSKYSSDSDSSVSDKDTIDTKGYYSQCDKTFVGWYHGTNGKWGCFNAEKVKIENYRVNEVNYDSLNSMKFVPLKYQRKKLNQNYLNNISEEGPKTYEEFLKGINTENYENVPHLDIYFLNDNTKENKDNDKEHGTSSFLGLKSKLFQPDYGYVNKINNDVHSTWKAKVYNNFIGKTYSEMRYLLGNSNSLPMMVQSSPQPSFSSFLELSMEISEKSSTKTSNSVFGELPSSFTWTNIDGVNYDSPVRTQGDCGSCYSISAISVMESRIRIKTNNRLKPTLSPSSPVGCSRYNQGCQGGYPYLVGKFGKEFGFVEDSCHPYEENDEKCIGYCFNQKVYKVKDYGYVGGYYGNCDEQKMMEEIYHNGPIVVAINATPELYYYESGIFKSQASRKEGTLEKNVKPWEYTNHAVVCVGWGEETNQEDNTTEKYWILKNSWGEEWGEKGYFRMERGNNNGSVEAQGVFLVPDI